MDPVNYCASEFSFYCRKLNPLSSKYNKDYRESNPFKANFETLHITNSAFFGMQNNISSKTSLLIVWKESNSHAVLDLRSYSKRLSNFVITLGLECYFSLVAMWRFFSLNLFFSWVSGETTFLFCTIEWSVSCQDARAFSSHFKTTFSGLLSDFLTGRQRNVLLSSCQ